MSIYLLGQVLQNIDARGANLCVSWLQVDTDTVLLDGVKLDDTLLMLSHDRVIAPEKHGFVLEKKKSNISLRL